MKHILKLTLLIAVMAFGAGCTTGYWADRGRDAGDVFTATLGVGVGGKVRVGPLQTGVLYQMDLVGLRGGCWGYLTNEKSLVFDYHDCYDSQFFLVGEEHFRPYHLNVSERAKDFHAGCEWGDIRMPFYQPSDNPNYYTQLEVVVALWPSVRVGFNPGELLDLILGFVGVDIYNDDLARRKKRSIEQDSPSLTGAD